MEKNPLSREQVHRGPLVWVKRLASGLSLAIFVAALLLLHHMLRRFHVADAIAQVQRTPPRALMSALILTAASYLALAGFDGLGASYIGRRLATVRIVLISFVSHAVSHSAGFATLTGGAIRYRMYSAVGLSAGEVAAVVAFCGLTFGLGASSLAALALLAEPHLLSSVLQLPSPLLRGLGGILGIGVVAYVAWGALARRPLRIFRRDYPVPPPRLAISQICVAAADLALASAVLFVLLPEATRPGYPAFLGAYVVANLLGLLAHVPGGLGVFDAAILILTPGSSPESVVGALLLFRGFYNLLPLGLAALILLAYELLERVPAAARRIGGLFDEMGPPLLSMLVFAAGTLTVFAHAIPPDLDGSPPLAWYFGGSLEAAAATALMVLARGLNQRNRWARFLSLACLLLLAALVLAQDPFAPRALILGLLAVIMTLAGDLFDPEFTAPPPPLSLPWQLAVGAMVAGACWLTWWETRTRSLPLTAVRPALWADGATLAVFAIALLRGVLVTGRHRTSSQPTTWSNDDNDNNDGRRGQS